MILWAGNSQIPSCDDNDQEIKIQRRITYRNHYDRLSKELLTRLFLPQVIELKIDHKSMSDLVPLVGESCYLLQAFPQPLRNGVNN
jgi:hypothetical protein